jgi:hypothetical protein
MYNRSKKNHFSYDNVTEILILFLGLEKTLANLMGLGHEN